MSNCDNNCDAVAGLHEAAANLIQYRNLINSWLNGGQNQTVNIGGVNTPTLLNLAMSIKQLVGVTPDNITIKIDPTTKKIYVPLKPQGGVHKDNTGLYIDSSDFLQLGGGLAKDANGNIYVDFDQMPTNKFDSILETFRKGLRLPKWLSASTHFYVDKNHAQAADTLDEGRGLSASFPFKTIQACVNYVCDNINVNRFIATIHVASGQYDPVSLGAFSRTTGHIVLQGSGSSTVIKRQSLGYGIYCSGGRWLIKDMKVEIELDFDEITDTNSIYLYGIATIGDGYTTCSGIQVSFKQLGTNNTGLRRVCYGYHTTGTMELEPGSTQARIDFDFEDTDDQHFLRYGISCDSANVTLMSTFDTSLNGNIICSGDFTAFAYASSKGAFNTASRSRPVGISFSGNCTGRRYACNTGGTIYTNNGGPEFFPGNTDGTVDATTYSWYK